MRQSRAAAKTIARVQDPPGPKERIKREAMRLFVDHGVDAVLMRDIADAAGPKAPSLYAHVRRREELIGDLFFASYAEYGRRPAEGAATPGGFQRRLETMVRVICALHDEDEPLPGVMFVAALVAWAFTYVGLPWEMRGCLMPRPRPR